MRSSDCFSVNKLASCNESAQLQGLAVRSSTSDSLEHVCGSAPARQKGRAASEGNLSCHPLYGLQVEDVNTGRGRVMGVVRNRGVLGKSL